MKFSEIDFGYTSSETEQAEHPDLLINGYADLKGMSNEAIEGKTFVFLGYKGSGKTGIGARLKLLSLQRHDLFVTNISLKDFSYSQLAKVVRGDMEPEAKYPTAWSWLLMPYLFESLSSDAGAKVPPNEKFENLLSALRQMGLSSNSDPSEIVRSSTKRSFQLFAPGQMGGIGFDTEGKMSLSELPDFVESAKSILRECRSGSKHIVVIDGLDEMLTVRRDQFRALGALLNELLAVNQDFRRSGVPIKIVLLCRTDLFEIIECANKNKIRQDYSFVIDWYHDPKEPDRSFLISAVNSRARLSFGRAIDIFEEIMPKKIEGDVTRDYILDYTRHTPRDMLQLFRSIQSMCDKNKGASRPSEREILSGIRAYSLNYFLPEVKDELVGYAQPDEINELFQLLGRLRRRDFYFKDLIKFAVDSSSTLGEDGIFKMLRVLFNCSAIGNVQRSGSQRFYTFKYRNPNSSLNKEDGIMLHKGLWKALNAV